MQRDYDAAGNSVSWAERALVGAEKDAAKVTDLSGDNFTAKAGKARKAARIMKIFTHRRFRITQLLWIVPAILRRWSG